MNDNFTPTAIANQALDQAAVDESIGDIQEGSRPANVCLRAYSECLRQLLRAAPWDFARKEPPLLLLADRTGQTSGVGTLVPGGWIYSYAYPTDMAKLRYIPWSPLTNVGVPTGNITPANPALPLVNNLSQAPYSGQRIVPSRFLVTSDTNYIPEGASNDTAGISPIGRTVILSNVQNASCVYTFDATYPNLWDHQFRAALVSYLASEIALPLSKDKKFGRAMRDDLVGLVRSKVTDARVSSANENWNVGDIEVDWMRARYSGGIGVYGSGGWSGEYGCWGGGWAGSLPMASGASF